MLCKTWNLLAAKYFNPLCTNRFFPEPANQSCSICVTPKKVTVGCGGACWDGSPPASITVSVGAFVAANGADLSAYTGTFGLTRTGVRADCCVYTGRSPGMKPYTLNYGTPWATTVPVSAQVPDMTAEICSGGSGFFRMRIAGDPLASFFTGIPGQPAGFTWDLFPASRSHQCTSPWTLPRASMTPASPAGPGDSSVLFVGQVTPPSTVSLQW
jgi:hypothetical protein